MNKHFTIFNHTFSFALDHCCLEDSHTVLNIPQFPSLDRTGLKTIWIQPKKQLCLNWTLLAILLVKRQPKRREGSCQCYIPFQSQRDFQCESFSLFYTKKSKTAIWKTHLRGSRKEVSILLSSEEGLWTEMWVMRTTSSLLVVLQKGQTNPWAIPACLHGSRLHV